MTRAATKCKQTPRWGAGRGGGCELMIGCVAKAAADEIHTNQEEMEEVRWVSRADVATAVAASARPDSAYESAQPLPVLSASGVAVCSLFVTCTSLDQQVVCLAIACIARHGS